MNKKQIFCIAISLSFFCAFAQQTDKSSLLAFQSNSEVLVGGYKNNLSELKKLEQLIAPYERELLSGQYHVAITSFIRPESTKDIYALNMASIQGSVVRAYIKTKYGLTNDAFTFRIDNILNIDNTVLIELISSPVGSANSSIHFTRSRDPGTIATVMLGSKALPDRSAITGASQVPVKNEQVVATPTPPEQVTVAPTPTEQKAKEPQQNEVVGRTTATTDSLQLRMPIFGLRTNLFYWALLQPNLGVDFYVGDRLSLHFEGMLSKWTNYSKGKNYAVNMRSLELRYWIRPNKGAFTGHHIGAYYHLGQYDLKFNETGYTGDYYGGGVSYGYTMPLKKKLFIEFSVRAGAINTPYDTYTYEEPEYIYQQSSRTTYWGITGASISLIYRFGKK